MVEELEYVTSEEMLRAFCDSLYPGEELLKRDVIATIWCIQGKHTKMEPVSLPRCTAEKQRASGCKLKWVDIC